MSQSFFVLQGQHEDLARDEVISISKSYDSKTDSRSASRLVILKSKASWKKVASRATFVRTSGILEGTFDDISKIDPIISKPPSFVCRAINLSSKRISSTSVEKQAGEVLKRRWGSNVSLSNPHLTVYLIITDSEQYLGYADCQIEPKFATKTIKYPHELDSKISRCMINLSGLNEGKTLCDPFCGTGTILLEAESMGIKSIGVDFDPQMCDITRENLSVNGFTSRVINSTYHEIQQIKDKIDAIVSDPPYGIASRSSISPKKLIKDFISILPKRKKLVIVYKKGLDVEEMSQAKKYEIYRHKSLTRIIAVR